MFKKIAMKSSKRLTRRSQQTRGLGDRFASFMASDFWWTLGASEIQTSDHPQEFHDESHLGISICLLSRMSIG
jgi:hypothetical protein